MDFVFNLSDEPILKGLDSGFLKKPVITPEMRKAIVAFATGGGYAKAAKAAGVDKRTIRKWVNRPEFLLDLGAVVVGLAGCLEAEHDKSKRKSRRKK